MEVQRLVVEETQHALTFEFHPGLTVAFHENPAVRARFIAEFIEGLGPSRSGVHLELTDTQNRHLAIFRPFGDRHRVIDIDRAFDVSPQYTGPNHRVDVLGRSGLDPASALKRMRLTANQVDRGIDSGTDDHRQARALAAVDQKQLWALAPLVDAAERRLADAQAQVHVPVSEAAALQRVAEVHARTELAARDHRRVLTLGGIVGGGCAALGIALLVLDGVLEDRAFTAKALLVLAAIAIGLSLADRRHLTRARKAEESALAGLGARSAETFAAAAERVGGDGPARTELLAAAEEAGQLDTQWRDLAGEASASWALANRAAIERLVLQREQMASIGAVHLACEEGTVADSARVLVDKVIELREVGFARERLPLVLDEPFIGFDPEDVEVLLETVMRLTSQHQILLVTGDPFIQEWATSAEPSSVGFLRIGRPVPTTTNA